MEKTNFAETIDLNLLEQGDSSTVLKVIHHLIFRASERFTNHIQEYVTKING